MLSRRQILATGAAAAVIGTNRRSLAQTTVTRRSIGSMSINDPDIQAYRRAVAAMKTLPSSDFKNWISQANIHANWCPHRNWYFLPWHRAYLTAFERICRILSGKSDFALPYWDWTSDRQIAKACSSGTPASNPLNHPRPGFSDTDSLPDDMVGTDVITNILASPDYESFGSGRPPGQNSTSSSWQRAAGTETELEFNPHDGVHGALNGDMGQVRLSPRDPIFWLHHCNIDRIWSLWTAKGGKNTDDPNWKNFSFDRQFQNVDGSFWTVKVSDLFSTTDLGYEYGAQVSKASINPGLLLNFENFRSLDPQALGQVANKLQLLSLPGGSTVHVASATNEASAKSDRPLSVPISVGPDLTDVFKPAKVAPSGSNGILEGASQRIVATVFGMQPPKDSLTRVRLFVNCDYLSPRTPVSDPHYVTSFSFLQDEHSHKEGYSISADITAVISKLVVAQSLKLDQIVVQLLPSSPTKEPSLTEVRPQKVQIAIL